MWLCSRCFGLVVCMNGDIHRRVQLYDELMLRRHLGADLGRGVGDTSET